MTITKEIIQDLMPLYVADECSRDSRAAVEAYLQAHPAEADHLRRIVEVSLPGAVPRVALDEVALFREARRRMRRRAWLMGLAIFFSLAPFSFVYTNGRLWMLCLEAPAAAAAYGVFGVAAWAWWYWERRQCGNSDI